MSLLTDREGLAVLLSTVAGVRGYAYRPSVVAQGCAWPMLVQLERDEETPDFQATWRVVLVLPGVDEPSAMKWMDAHIEPVTEALEDFAYVSTVNPGQIATSAGDLNAVFFTLRKEA